MRKPDVTIPDEQPPAELVIEDLTVGDGDEAGRILRILLPIERAASRAGIDRYRVEPYVLAADIGGNFVDLGR